MENIKIIVKSLNKAKYQSKLDGAYIGYIIARWRKIKDELEWLYDTGKFLQLVSVLGPEKEFLNNLSDRLLILIRRRIV